MTTKTTPTTTLGERFIKVADLRPYMKAINCVFIVLEKDPPTKTKDEHSIHQCLVADYTGSIYFSLWDTVGEQVQPGDIVKLKGGYATLFKHSLVLYVGQKGSLERVGEFTMVFSETPNMSLLQWVNDAANPKLYIPLQPGAPNPAVAPLPQGHMQPVNSAIQQLPPLQQRPNNNAYNLQKRE